ncbi:MAG TPA: threonine synthase [archaeon]|nr:threonine synthase [archaeon]
MSKAFLKCIECGNEFAASEKIYKCSCGDLLDVLYDFSGINAAALKETFRQRRLSNELIDLSGVWRFRELIPFLESPENIVSLPEGNTPIFSAAKSAEYAGVKKLSMKHQGLNPTGSFKDNGMTAAISKAKEIGAKTVVCASTGNTSASMAAYAAKAGMDAVVLIPKGQIAFGKLSQALDFGAKTFQIDGDFDSAMKLVQEISLEKEIYLMNSINPFRLEGQKTIAIELMEQRSWKAPDRIVVPGGNLGNASAIGKGVKELFDLGFIGKMPMITIIQATGADPLYRTLTTSSEELVPIKAKTLATAIKIGNPINWRKAVRAMDDTRGWCDEVSEQEIADAKAIIGKDGIGCEPASATTLAGIKKLVGTEIDKSEDIVAILTGHMLKDTDYTLNYHFNSLYERGKYAARPLKKGSGKIKSTFANPPKKIRGTMKELRKAMGLK